MYAGKIPAYAQIIPKGLYLELCFILVTFSQKFIELITVLNLSSQSIIHEDKLLSRLETLENQLELVTKVWFLYSTNKICSVQSIIQGCWDHKRFFHQILSIAHIYIHVPPCHIFDNLGQWICSKLNIHL